MQLRPRSFAFSCPVAGLLALLLVSGCATTSTLQQPIVAQPTDVPEQFLVGAHEGSETSAPRPGEGCRNPMVDPRDGTRLVLDRATEGVGDYEVPPGRYGVEVGTLLRLDCGTGRVLGIVRR